MKYLHPDVIQNGPAVIANSSTQVLAVPNYFLGMSYADAIASAAIVAVVSPANYSFNESQLATQLLFVGIQVSALGSAGPFSGVHFLHTDGVSRILWVDQESTGQPILAGQTYQIPAMRLLYEIS